MRSMMYLLIGQLVWSVVSCLLCSDWSVVIGLLCSDLSDTAQSVVIGLLYSD